jgi:two-component system phosphate regulon sensor histidine kinase PhoR
MRQDVFRLIVALLAGWLGGILVGHAAAGAAVGLGLHALWQQRALRRLLEWVEHPKAAEPPEHRGVFEELSVAIERLRGRHKKRKKKLAGFLRQFQQATAALPDATIVLGPHNEIQWANSAAARHLGVRWPQDARQRLSNLLRSPDLVAALAATTADGPAVEIESPLNPDLILSVRIVPYGDEQRLFVARDVSRMHHLNEIRRDFVANVSHELKTPLTVFSGYLETLENDKKLCPRPWRPVLTQLREHADRMQTIVSELLLLSRLEAEDSIRDPELVVVPEMIGDIHKQAQALSGERRHIFFLAVDPSLWISGVQAELHSAFANLVFNAVQYTPARGVIRVRWYQDAAGAHFLVQDQGIGIAPQHIARITERFYRVDPGRSRAEGGTGLGLAIVKHVLQRHGARLHIDSVLGQGSTFRCDFPEAIVMRPETVDLDELA